MLSSKYGKCHTGSISATPSSERNSVDTRVAVMGWPSGRGRDVGADRRTRTNSSSRRARPRARSSTTLPSLSGGYRQQRRARLILGGGRRGPEGGSRGGRGVGSAAQGEREGQADREVLDGEERRRFRRHRSEGPQERDEQHDGARHEPGELAPAGPTGGQPAEQGAHAPRGVPDDERRDG